MNIEPEQIIGLIETVRAGLGKGSNQRNAWRRPCIEDVVAIATGQHLTDKPTCAIEAAHQYGWKLNDWGGWSSPQARGDALMRYGIAQIGSAGVVDEIEWVRLVAEMTIREIVPIALRAVGTNEYDEAARRCEREGTAAVAAVATAAIVVGFDAAATYDAAYYAAKAAHHANAANAERTTYYAAVAAVATAATTTDGERVMRLAAEIGVRAFEQLGSPGCQMLWLTKPDAIERYMAGEGE